MSVADDKSSPLASVPQNTPKVRLFCACDGGVVKIHVPAHKGEALPTITHIDNVEEHNALSSISTKSDHDVGWTHELHTGDPRNWPTWRKWAVTLIVSSISLCSTYTSSVYTTTYEQIIRDFHTSKEVAILGLSLYVLGLGLGPVLLAPLSEFFGRRPIYLVSWAGFVIWLIPCAVARDIQTMLVARFFNGVCGSGFMSVAGGTVGDLFNVHELALPMMVYTASPFVGPELGPIIGGFICQNADWRWVYYVLIIWSSLAYVAIIVAVPETYGPILHKKRASTASEEIGEEDGSLPAKPKKSILSTVGHSCLRPVQLLIFKPMCLALCTFSAIILGILYLFFEAFPLVFGGVYGFSLQQTGLAFIGLLVGMCIGLATDPFWDRHYERLFAKSPAHPPSPELRLPPAMAGGLLVPIGIFWFAWTARASVHWIVPIIGTSIFGIGVLLTFSGIFTFLVDAYPQYAASGLASNSFLRSCFAAGFPLFAIQMYHRLGNAWATSLLGFIALACAPFPLAKTIDQVLILQIWGGFAPAEQICTTGMTMGKQVWVETDDIEVGGLRSRLGT